MSNTLTAIAPSASTTLKGSGPLSCSVTKAPRTVPFSWYTSDNFVSAAKEHIYDKGWIFLSSVNAFAKDPKDNDGLTGALQLDFIRNPFFGLLTVEDSYKANSVELYYGVYEDVVKGLTTEEEKAAKIATLKKVNNIVTPSGLVFISHEETPSKSFEEYFGYELEQFIGGDADFRSKKLRRRLVYECDYNVLTFIDGYQECLHCSYTHPAFSKVYPFEFYKIDTYTNFCRHHCNPAETTPDEKGLFLYFFPSCTLNMYGGGMGIFRCSPLSGQKCRMEFEYFFEGSDEDFEAYFKFARQVALEDIWLCEAAQKNLAQGIYQQGLLHPDKENGVVYYQRLFRDRIMNDGKY